MTINHLRRRIPAVCLLLIFIFALLPPSAQALVDPETEATAAYLAATDGERPLFTKAGDEKRYPASTTKIMTALLVLENTTLTDTITATAEDVDIGAGSSNADIKAGETVTISDLLYCLMLPSANEAANMLARHVGGSIEKFVEMMNQRAAALGCTGTHFVNPNGLHDDNHYTTAHDLYLITCEALKNETFAEIVNTAQKTLQPTNVHEARKIYTTNYLILRKSDPQYYDYCHGVKTGHTSEAGFCLVSVAEKDDVQLVSVVLGCTRPEGTNVANTFAESKKLFEWGFSNFAVKTLVNKDKPIAEVPVRLSTDADYVVLETKGDLTATVPIDIDLTKLTFTKNVPESLTAPIKAGDSLGTMDISYDGVNYGTVDLVAVGDVSLSQVLFYADKLENFFHSRLFLIIVLIIAALIALLIILRLIHVARRKKIRKRLKRDQDARYRKLK